MTTARREQVGEPATLQFAAGSVRVPYVLSTQIDDFLRHVGAVRADRWIVVASTNPHTRSFVSVVSEGLHKHAPVTAIAFADHERGKTLGTLGVVCARAIEAGATRSSCIVGVGGGIVCNVAGLAASLLFRGIRLVQVPTTLLAMTDAVISLKQGINVLNLKNGIGSYYTPELVWANPEVLKTLPAEAVRAGIAELIKNVLAISPDDIPILRDILRRDASYDSGDFMAFIHLALDSKARLLVDDPEERGPALALEYGHTVGHALEILTQGEISHGIGVGLGMRVAARVAHKRGMIGEDEVDAHDELLARAGLPLTCDDAGVRVNARSIAQQLAMDNKRGYIDVSPDEVAMVLISGLGKPTPRRRPLTPVPVEQVLGACAATIL